MDHAQEQAQERPLESNPLDPQEQATSPDAQKSAQDSSGAQDTAANQDTQATEFNRTTTTTIIAPSGADTTSTTQTPADTADTAAANQATQASTQGTATPPPTLPTLDTQTLQAPDTSKIDEFKETLEQAITQNEGVLANTHYTLQGIATLLEISKDLWAFYKYHAEAIQLSSEQLQDFKKSLQTISTYTTQTLETIAHSHAAAQRLFTTTEALLDETKREMLKIDDDLQTTKETLKKLQEIELSLPQIRELTAEFRAILALAEALKQEINALVPNILNEVKVNLLADKEQYEGELEAKKDEYINLLGQKLSTLDEKIQDFEASYIQKQRTMEDALRRLEEFIDTLEAEKVEFRTRFETYMRELLESKNAHKTELESFKDEKKGEIESFKGEKTTQLQAFKDEKLAEIKAHTLTQKNTLEAHRQNALNDMRIFSENYLQEVNAFSQAQILELRELYYAIATNAQQLGNKYKSQTFTTSQTFTLIDGVRDYFVFVRGGTGGDNSRTAGGISSFGDFVSANGGAGNSGGAGQRGESKAQFIYIEDENVTEVQVAVAIGGVVIVSYPSDLETKLDTSFLSDGDLAILSNSSDEQAKTQWIKDNITNKKQENYYRNLVGLSITLAPITEQNLARILNENQAQKYPSTRHLELELGKTYLNTNKSISEQIQELINSVERISLQATPESLSLEMGQSQQLEITTKADFTALTANEHISFDKEQKRLQAVSVGTSSLELRAYDDLHQEHITARISVEVEAPPAPQEPTDTDQATI